MARGYNKFLEGIKFQDGEASQKEVAEEAIKKQLFNIITNAKLQKGESIDINETVRQIADNLGLQEHKTKVMQYIIALFKSGDYQYDLNEDGNIRANYSRIYMIQKECDQKGKEEADGILRGFIERVEDYVKKMEQQKAIITDASIMNQFSEEELQKNGEWIDLAIDHVLEARNNGR